MNFDHGFYKMKLTRGETLWILNIALQNEYYPHFNKGDHLINPNCGFLK